MPVIYLIRHGQASFGKEDYDQLSEMGWEQSRILGRALQNQDLGVPRSICGTMRRHVETAEATLGELGLAKEWHTDTGFNEYNHSELLAVDWPLASDRAACSTWSATKSRCSAPPTTSRRSSSCSLRALKSAIRSMPAASRCPMGMSL